MKKLLILFLLFPFHSYAEGVTVVEDKQGLWDVLFTSPSGKEYLIYKEQYQITSASGDGQALFYQTRENIFYIMYNCYENQDDSCIRYINLTTDKISRVIYNPALMVDANENLLGPIDNLKQGVVLTFGYPEDDHYTITTIFQSCKNPFKYITPYQSIGPEVGSKFLENGNLYLNMASIYAPAKELTIPIDYDKLYKNCNN